MNDNIIILFIVLCIIAIISFGIFSYSAIDNLSDSLSNKTYQKSYLFKGIGCLFIVLFMDLFLLKFLIY